MVAGHAVLPQKLRLGHPLHAVAEGNVDVRGHLGDVELALRVRRHVHAHHLVLVVPDAEVQVRVQVPACRLDVP